MVVIDLTGEASPRSSEASSAIYGAHAGTDSGPSCTPIEYDEAELTDPLIEVEAEENSCPCTLHRPVGRQRPIQRGQDGGVNSLLS